MGLSVPITADALGKEILANINKAKVSTPVGGDIDKDGKFVGKFESKPDMTPAAVAKATGDAVHAALKAILTSQSINVTGVIG